MPAGIIGVPCLAPAGRRGSVAEDLIVYADTLSIYDFKCFGKAVLRLHHPRRRNDLRLKNVNLVLGDNGAGKSSVLRALAIAVLAPALLGSGFVPYRLVRRSGQEAGDAGKALLKVDGVAEASEKEYLPSRRKFELLAKIDARPGDRDRLHLDSTPATPIAALLDDDTSPAFFVVGYGATRRVETGDYVPSSARRARGLRYQRIAGLFEDHLALRPMQDWLPRLRYRAPDRYDAAVRRINDVLPEDIRFAGEINSNDQYLFTFRGVETPFPALSDGYKAFIGWIADLLGHMTDVLPDGGELDDLAGIVLVDEIDLHLHPSWQRRIVPDLARVFPKLQFVFTSHSPIVAATVESANVFVTDTDDHGLATIRQLDEKTLGRTPDQLLLSGYFGLETTRPETFRKEAQDLFARAAGGDGRAALEYLERLVGGSERGGA